jgi:hypothetical protein
MNTAGRLTSVSVHAPNARVTGVDHDDEVTSIEGLAQEQTWRWVRLHLERQEHNRSCRPGDKKPVYVEGVG